MPYLALKIAVDPPFTKDEAENAAKQAALTMEPPNDKRFPDLRERRCHELLVQGLNVPFDFCGHDWQGVCRWSNLWPDRFVMFEFIASEWEGCSAERFYFRGRVELATTSTWFPDDDLTHPERWKWKDDIVLVNNTTCGQFPNPLLSRIFDLKGIDFEQEVETWIDRAFETLLEIAVLIESKPKIKKRIFQLLPDEMYDRVDISIGMVFSQPMFYVHQSVR